MSGDLQIGLAFKGGEVYIQLEDLQGWEFKMRSVVSLAALGLFTVCMFCMAALAAAAPFHYGQ